MAEDAFGALDDREEKAPMFHDVRESLCVTCPCAFLELEDTGAHLKKAQRVRQGQMGDS